MDKKASAAELMAFGLVAAVALGGMVWFLSGNATNQTTGNGIARTICSDTDAGIDYNIRGTVAWGYGDFTDTCADNRNIPVDGNGPKVIEYYCKGGAMFTSVHRCPTGCRDGACT